MQKTYIFTHYIAAKREDGRPVMFEANIAPFVKRSTDRAAAIAKEGGCTVADLVRFTERPLDKPYAELVVVDDELWNKYSTPIAEGQSKAGMVTRTGKQGYSVRVIILNEDFKEEVKLVEGLKDKDPETVRKAVPFFLRVEGEYVEMGGCRGMSDELFYELGIKYPVED